MVNGEERLYSQKLACPECGTSVPAAGAALVFLQQPLRRVRGCDGLGSKWAFDPAKVIADPSKPLLDGGLGPGADPPTCSTSSMDAARQLRINLSKPFEDLPKKIADAPAGGRRRVCRAF